MKWRLASLSKCLNDLKTRMILSAMSYDSLKSQTSDVQNQTLPLEKVGDTTAVYNHKLIKVTPTSRNYMDNG